MSIQYNKLPIGIIFRQMREKKGLLIRQVAAVTELDQAIISRIENCDRLPTKEQLLKLSGLYNLDLNEMTSAWLAEKMVRDYGDEPTISHALMVAHERITIDMDNDSNLFSDKTRFYDKPSEEDEKNKKMKRKPGRKGDKPGK